MIRINKRYSYCNKDKSDGDPVDDYYLYDHYVDILYPRIKEGRHKGRKIMVFDDFTHNRRLYLFYREDDKYGMLDLRKVYTWELVPTYREIDENERW